MLFATATMPDKMASPVWEVDADTESALDAEFCVNPAALVALVAASAWETHALPAEVAAFVALSDAALA